MRSPRQAWAGDRLITRLSAAFAAAGLDPVRYLREARWMGAREFLGFLDEMDVLLDCPAFSGYTTAWQAINRGLPIVTLEGAFLRQRLAAGLLRHIGRDGGIARNEAEYVTHAISLADRCRRADERARLRWAIERAAPRADLNAAAIRAMEATFIGS